MFYQRASATSLRFDNAAWSLSSILLIMFGVSLILIGFYFAFLRPPLLPEDLRYSGALQAQLDTVAPQLASWLKQEFRVMGGYIAATGVLTISLAATSFRLHSRVAAFGTLIGGLVSIAWMATINFLIDSDFKWVLVGVVLLWACSMGRFWSETRSCRVG